MWLIEIVLIVAVFVIGVWMPTDRSDDFAARHGIREENARKRATIQRAQTAYSNQHPWSVPLYRGSILGFALGFTVVMIATIHGRGEPLDEWQNIAAGVGYAIQICTAVMFAICSLTKRHALVKALNEDKRLKQSEL